MSEFLWGIYPYIAIVLFFVVPIMRMVYRPFSWSSRASSLFGRRSLGVASILMHWGLFLVLIGHLLGLFGGLVGSSLAITAFFWTGLVGGVMVLLGSGLALYRRLTIPEVRAMSQPDDYIVHLFLIPIVGVALYQVIAHRIFGIAYNTSAWVASLWRLSPQPELMASSSLLTKIHILLAVTFLAYFPFTKLVHAWTYPVNYFVRPYQSIRTARFVSQRKWEMALRSDKSWLAYGLGSVVVLFVVSGLLLGRSSGAVDTANGDPAMSKDGQLMGEALYVSQCARCHGVDGSGDGPGAQSPTFATVPRDLTADKLHFVSTKNGVPTREDLRRVIREGIPAGGMPAFDALSEAQVSSLIEVLERMGDGRPEPEPIEVPPRPSDLQSARSLGADVYAQNCAMCHGETGRGDGPAAGAASDRAGNAIMPRDFVTDDFKISSEPEEMYLRVAAGIPSGDSGSVMPAYHATLSSEEIWGVVEYIRAELMAQR